MPRVPHPHPQPLRLDYPMEMSTCLYEEVNMVLYGSLYQSRTGNNLDAHQNRIVAYCTAITIKDQTIQNPVRDVNLSERNQKNITSDFVCIKHEDVLKVRIITGLGMEQ